MMEDFVKKVIEGNGIKPPQACLSAFNQNFSGAVNIEWFDKKTCYEAIFYKDNIEYIALFDTLGNLTEYKLYLPVDYLPEAIKSYIENLGEIMNAVLINKGNSIQYEVIIRDKNLKRSLVLMSDLGKVIEQKEL